MVNRAAQSDLMNDMNRWSRPGGKHYRRKGRFNVHIAFPDPLYLQILAEATQRQWSFAHMVRHLCESSIDGIE